MSARSAIAAALILAAPLIGVPPASASEVVVSGASCTVIHTPAEHEDVLALSGVFAANWSAEILRDIPSAAEDMAVARSWHADKTSDALAEIPEHVRAAVDRVNTAGHRVGYRDEEATAPLRVLVDRNDHRRTGRTWQTFSTDEARKHLETTRRTGAPTALSGTHENLSIPADESWQRAWERTPGARAEAAASSAELRLCAGRTAGTVDRATANAETHDAPVVSLLVLGVPLGHIHTTTVLRLLEEISAFSR
ncbi:hypothetical protein [Corynebacterium comes]|uniref:Secreted protein n=1 Tax=Corynebacterium comes TaxID=2675218 RepID=A0A6B8VGB4_9CORY|nr:hypothetical protein [Corynebacterium comes]QGU04332.1 hypothetical protein CETAM_05310 [Corynebacterium comes]